jgi:micrococcal nuclease
LLHLLLACAPKTVPPVEAPVEAAPSLVTTPAYSSVVVLDGVEVLADWDDGDTFSSPVEGDEPKRARLAGYNTLESYGPVHSWGEWTGEELYGLAKEAGRVASEGKWDCYVLPGGGGYGRDQVDCPELRQELLARGLAHLFVFDGEPLPADLAAQTEAIAQQRGMWAKGAPTWLVTSLHSLDEREGQVQTYNRLAHTGDGHVEKRMHEATYAPCESVCPADSCMIYVPYELRYDPDLQPDCLK